MDARQAVLLAAGLVPLSLLAAPVTMHDWGEQATLSAERVEESEYDDQRPPVLQFVDLSPRARDAVRSAIESPDGTHTVYGREDWPDRFEYTDAPSPGRGEYVVAYRGTRYELTTVGGGASLAPVLLTLPFVAYGVGLGLVVRRTARGEDATAVAGLTAAPGLLFHLLGPEFDFPWLGELGFLAFGTVATLLLALGFGARAHTPATPAPGPDD